MSFGQSNYKIEKIKFVNGLPSDNVINTTSFDGYLYIATQRGLCLYDGYQFVKQKNVDASTISLLVNNNHLYYFTSGEGLSKIKNIFEKPQQIAKVNFTNSTPNDDFYENLFIDSQQRAWCSDHANVKFINLKNKKSKSYPIFSSSGLNASELKFIEPYQQEIWIACKKGIFVWNATTQTLQKHPNKLLNSNKLIDAAYFNTNKIYCSSFNGSLFEFDKTSNKCIEIENLSTNKQPLHFVENYNISNSVLLYDNEQVFLYNLTSKNKTILYTSEKNINHVSYDKITHTIWVATVNGLVKISKNDDSVLTIETPLPSKTIIKSIVQDDAKNLWVTNNSNKLYCKTVLNIWKTFSISDTKVLLNNLSIYKNKLLIAANNGVYLVENEKIKQIISTNYEVRKAIFDTQNQIWVITEKNGIRVYDASTFTEKQNYVQNNADYWQTNEMHDIAVDKKGKIWLASWMPKDYGISFYDPISKTFVEINSLTKYKNTDLFISDYYNRIEIANDGTIIVSAIGGWNKVTHDGQIIGSLNTLKAKVANDHIEGIMQDNNGNIWFACAEGLNLYNAKTKEVARFSEIDGLLSNDLTNGFCKLFDNKIVLGVDSKIQIISLDKIIKTNLINQLKLTSVSSYGNQLPFVNNTISVNYDFTQLDLFFSALTFSNKEKIIYRYKFDNQNKWNYLGTIPKLSLIQLSPGEYHLTIEVGDNIGNWQKQNCIVTVLIKPPFYKTTWFISLLIFLLLLAAFLVNRFLVNQEKEKGNLKRKIVDSEMQTLRSQMNPHFLFNSLNSINSYIIQQKSKEASGYLTTFSKLMRNILENSRQESITLEKEIDTLKMYLELEAVRLDHKFDYEIIIDNQLEVEYLNIPPLIIQPFAENAIWHGLNNKKENGTIKIEFSTIKEEILIIKITDDGIGRKAATLLKKNQAAHKSFGIDITLNRLQLLNPKNNFEIIDLYDEKDNPKGTQVTLQIYYYD